MKERLRNLISLPWPTNASHCGTGLEGRRELLHSSRNAHAARLLPTAAEIYMETITNIDLRPRTPGLETPTTGHFEIWPTLYVAPRCFRRTVTSPHCPSLGTGKLVSFASGVYSNTLSSSTADFSVAHRNGVEFGRLRTHKRGFGIWARQLRRTELMCSLLHLTAYFDWNCFFRYEQPSLKQI